jgi:hypothetical protein
VLSLFPGLHDTGFDVAPENVALELSKDGQHAGKRVAARYRQARASLTIRSRLSETTTPVACSPDLRAIVPAIQSPYDNKVNLAPRAAAVLQSNSSHWTTCSEICLSLGRYNDRQ